MLIDPKNNNLTTQQLQNMSDLCKRGALLTFGDTFSSVITGQSFSLRCKVTVAYGLIGYERVSLHDSEPKYGFTVSGELSVKDVSIVKIENEGPVLEDTLLSLFKRMDTAVSSLITNLLECLSDTTDKIFVKEK